MTEPASDTPEVHTVELMALVSPNWREDPEAWSPDTWYYEDSFTGADGYSKAVELARELKSRRPSQTYRVTTLTVRDIF